MKIVLHNQCILILGWLNIYEKYIEEDVRINSVALESLISNGLVLHQQKRLSYPTDELTDCYKLSPYGLRVYNSLVSVLSLCED